MRLWLTSKPDVFFRKPKPAAMCCVSRLVRALTMISKAIQASTITNRVCTATPFQPAAPPSARFSRSSTCSGGDRVSMLIAAPPQAEQSADRRRVLDSALVPELVQSASDLQPGAGADIAIERLAVVTDRLDDAVEPVLGQPELFAEIAVDPKGAFDVRLVGLRHLVDVL